MHNQKTQDMELFTRSKLYYTEKNKQTAKLNLYTTLSIALLQIKIRINHKDKRNEELTKAKWSPLDIMSEAINAYCWQRPLMTQRAH